MVLRWPLICVVLLALAPLTAESQPTPPTTVPTPPTTQPAAAPLDVNDILNQVRAALKSGKLRGDKDGKELAKSLMNLLQRALEKDQANTEVKLLAGEVMVATDQYDEARDYFKEVLENEPNNYRANLGYGKILNATRAWRQAAHYLEQAEKVAGDDRERARDTKTALARAYAGMSSLKDAIDKADEAVKLDRTDPGAMQTAVEVRLLAAARGPEYVEGAHQQAEAFVEQAKAAASAQAWDRERLETLDTAYELLTSALREYQKSLYVHNLRGEPTNQLLRGKEVEAAAALDEVATVLVERAALRFTLAQHDAIEMLKVAVEYHPKEVKYLERLAGLYQQIKDRDNAVKTCQRILELDPNHEQARQYLESVGATPAPGDGNTTSR